MASGGGLRLGFTVAVVCGVVLGGTGCGGGSETQTLMPAVEGLRLDVALSDLAGQGVAEEDVEVVGGGTLGVLDESNWDVCEQRPAAGTPIQDVRLIVDRVCGDDDSGSASGADSTSDADVPEGETTTGADAASEESAAEVDASTSGSLDSPAAFAISAGGDIADMRKDLRDSADALADGGRLRLSTNLAELSFNYGQLDALDAPEPVRAEWEAAMSSLDGALEDYRTALEGDSLDGVGQALVTIAAALDQLAAVVESAA
jgi:hypothetical protein